MRARDHFFPPRREAYPRRDASTLLNLTRIALALTLRTLAYLVGEGEREGEREARTSLARAKRLSPTSPKNTASAGISLFQFSLRYSFLGFPFLTV